MGTYVRIKVKSQACTNVAKSSGDECALRKGDSSPEFVFKWMCVPWGIVAYHLLSFPRVPALLCVEWPWKIIFTHQLSNLTA